MYARCSVFMARQFAWSVKRIMWSSNIVKMFHEAARKIQKLIIHRTRRRNMAATKFQALYRGWHYRMTIIMAKRDLQRRIALVGADVSLLLHAGPLALVPRTPPHPPPMLVRALRRSWIAGTR